MPSPFSQFSGNTGPVPDVYNATVKSREPIAEGIMALGKGIGAYMGEKAKAEEDAKDRESKANSEANKLGWEREKFRLEQEAAAEKAQYDRIKGYMDQKTKERELKIKGSEGKYDRLKGRLDDISAEIGGYSTAYPDGLPPDVAQRVKELEAVKKQIGDQMIAVGKEIEGHYDQGDTTSAYLQEYDNWMQRRGNLRKIELENYGKPPEQFDPFSNNRLEDGSINPNNISVTQGSMPKDSYLVAPNVVMSGPGNSPIFQGGGMGVLPGPEPKFRDSVNQSGSADGNAGAEPPRYPGVSGDGRWMAELPGSGLTQYQPVGSNPYATEISSKWQTANVHEDQAPDPRSDGGRIVFDPKTNKFALGINPDVNDSNRDVLNRLGAITAFANGMSSEQAFNLSNILREDRAKQAADLFKVLKSKGMIPAEMDFVKFKAAVAASLYSENSSSLGNVSPEQASAFGAVLRAAKPGEPIDKLEQENLNRGTLIVSPASTPVPELTPVIPSTQWRPPFDVDRTKRLMASGVFVSGPRTKHMFEMAKFLDAQGMALARLRAQQDASAAAIASAETNMVRANSEAAKQTGMFEALLPGIGNSVGGGDVAFYNRTLGNADNVDVSSMWRSEAQRAGNLSAWNAVIGNYGFNEKLEQERYQNAVDASTSFERGFGGAMTIMSLFESQMGKNWTELTYERIVGDKAAVAAQYRLFLLGAFRKATVGLGNPSNFEQELLLNLIPDPTSPFQITQKSVAKSRMLVLMTMANHMTDMESAKFVMSDKTAEHYSRKLVEAGVLAPGQKLTVSDLKGFRSILRRNAGNPEASINELRVWARNTKAAGLSNLVEEVAGDMNIRGGTKEAYAVDRNVKQFLLVDTAHLDPSNPGLQRR